MPTNAHKCPQMTVAAKNKMKQTCLENYSFESTWEVPKFKKKSKITNILKFGVEHPRQSQEFLENIRKQYFEKYGIYHAQQSQEIRDKISISKVNSFQSRRNEEGTDFAGIVYILHFVHLSLVKIGLTASKENRFKDLEKDFGQFSIIKLIETDKCFALEKELHEMFSDERIILSEGGGRTEFFKEEILYDIQEILKLKEME